MFDAKLAVIRSPDEQQFLASLMRNGSFYWTGGLQLAKEKMSFVWIDGTQMSYAPWHISEPDNYLNKCIGVASIKEVWGDSLCSSVYYPICQRLNESETMLFDEFPITFADGVVHKMLRDEKFRVEIVHLLKRSKNRFFVPSGNSL
ncbi:hypothetical protein B4U79_16099 [Dinothrombium tinctorium]|uniref:C-type lectin domain-containing protein n=1 Tax=Dinothrombium tinctorium TaxID=1965070 RepID=A0A3S3NRK4_9ACAR|nr:hypothetical protein B4U79_16505 [Dinothrombium tinctorium]RWS07882.1 hypothetical protein B4U79_16102 [Dinothrombium tinctorium]RWS07885.1 hypothetical protein B4U79_16099 [Dinothrombium tinctorium]